jgi:hypothetical protein
MFEGDFVDAKKVALGGYLHLRQAPFGAAAAIKHCPDVPFWSGIAVGAAQAQYWSLLMVGQAFECYLKCWVHTDGQTHCSVLAEAIV